MSQNPPSPSPHRVGSAESTQPATTPSLSRSGSGRTHGSSIRNLLLGKSKAVDKGRQSPSDELSSLMQIIKALGSASSLLPAATCLSQQKITLDDFADTSDDAGSGSSPDSSKTDTSPDSLDTISPEHIQQHHHTSFIFKEEIEETHRPGASTSHQSSSQIGGPLRAIRRVRLSVSLPIQEQDVGPIMAATPTSNTIVPSKTDFSIETLGMGRDMSSRDGFQEMLITTPKSSNFSMPHSEGQASLSRQLMSKIDHVDFITHIEPGPLRGIVRQMVDMEEKDEEEEVRKDEEVVEAEELEEGEAQVFRTHRDLGRAVRVSISLTELLSQLVDLPDLKDSSTNTNSTVSDRTGTTNSVTSTLYRHVSSDIPRLSDMLQKSIDISGGDEALHVGTDQSRFESSRSSITNLRPHRATLVSPQPREESSTGAGWGGPRRIGQETILESSLEATEPHTQLIRNSNTTLDPYDVGKYARSFSSGDARNFDFAITAEEYSQKSSPDHSSNAVHENSGEQSSGSNVFQTVRAPPQVYRSTHANASAKGSDPESLRGSRESLISNTSLLEKDGLPSTSYNNAPTFSTGWFILLLVMGLLVPPIYFFVAAGVLDTSNSDRQYYGGLHFYGPMASYGKRFSRLQKQISIVAGTFWVLAVLTMVGIGFGIGVASEG